MCVSCKVTVAESSQARGQAAADGFRHLLHAAELKKQRDQNELHGDYQPAQEQVVDQIPPSELERQRVAAIAPSARIPARLMSTTFTLFPKYLRDPLSTMPCCSSPSPPQDSEKWDW